MLPNGQKTTADIYFDLEMQRKYYLNYDIASRAVYYTSRLISRQLATLTQTETYAKLRPVYSIWIVLKEFPKNLTNTVHHISLNRENDGAKINSNIFDRALDLMHIGFIFINKDVQEYENKLVMYLSSVFNNCVADSMRNPYHEHAGHIQKEVNKFMTLDEMVREEGREEGRAEGRIDSLMHLLKDGIITLQQAAKCAGLTESEFLERVTCNHALDPA